MAVNLSMYTMNTTWKKWTNEKYAPTTGPDEDNLMPITKDWTKVWSISDDAMGVEYGYTMNVVDFLTYPEDENKFSSYGQMSTKIAVR